MSLRKNFQTARFHVTTGPQSLFDRVRFKMSAVTRLDLHGAHYNRQAVNRNVPQYVLDKIVNFDAAQWQLVTCEVRADTGKFVNSTWEIIFNGQAYRITIGFNNTVMTVVAKKSSNAGNVVTEGALYDFVSKVNAELNLDVSSGLRL